jgi:hypothetical protein
VFDDLLLAYAAMIVSESLLLCITVVVLQRRIRPLGPVAPIEGKLRSRARTSSPLPRGSGCPAVAGGDGDPARSPWPPPPSTQRATASRGR